MNKVTIVGRLGKDPVLNHTNSDGTPVCNFSVATNERWKNKQGEQQERVDWHRIVVFGRRAEVIAEHAAQGSLLSIEGKLRYRKYTADISHKLADGMEIQVPVTRTVAEVLLTDFEFQGGKPKAKVSTEAGESAETETEAPKEQTQNVGDDDIPF